MTALRAIFQSCTGHRRTECPHALDAAGEALPAAAVRRPFEVGRSRPERGIDVILCLAGEGVHLFGGDAD